MSALAPLCRFGLWWRAKGEEGGPLAWGETGHCHTLYTRPGSPWENPFIESFNGASRAECLDRWIFADGREAQTIIKQ